MIADSPGSMVTRCRMDTIGSSTDPSVPESGDGSSIASGANTLLPATDEAHSVSLVAARLGGPTMRGHQMEHPGRRVVWLRVDVACKGWRRRLSRISVCTKRLPNAGA